MKTEKANQNKNRTCLRSQRPSSNEIRTFDTAQLCTESQGEYYLKESKVQTLSKSDLVSLIDELIEFTWRARSIPYSAVRKAENNFMREVLVRND